MSQAPPTTSAAPAAPDPDQTVPDGAAPAGGSADVLAHAARRRTFAVISHPDAGKSTVTEALALHAQAINRAGHVHGKAGRAGVVSDWQEMEQARGISISSAALQLQRRGHVLNLLDTPGHADFSEDTYRVLAAVDCAVMLLDGARGMQRQTRKLFEVCRHRGTPVITVVNKWDRPGREALELLDEVGEATGMTPTPVTWPVGVAGDFRGVVDRRTGTYAAFTRTAGGATLAGEEQLGAVAAAEREGPAWVTAQDELELLDAVGADHDPDGFLAGRTSPVLFTAAVLNFGVHQLLDALVDLAPAPAPRPTTTTPRPLDAPFSGQVFKIQAGMDRAHRDRIAFVRVCSGRFSRGMSVTNPRTGRTSVLKYAQQVFGASREVLDEAWPGDVVGLVNASNLQVGDTLVEGRPKVEFPPIPAFAPEHFAVARAVDTARYKQFQRGIAELDGEGVIQVLRSDLRGDQEPVLAAVGQMQYEVVEHRMREEMGSPVRLDHLPYSVVRAVRDDQVDQLAREHGCEVLRRPDGQRLAVFSDQWRMASVLRGHPDLELFPLVAAAGE